MKISIVIPTYNMINGVEYLNFSLSKIKTQKVNCDIEIIVTDHSNDDSIKNLCNEWINKLNIIYHKNTYKIGSSSANINTGISLASGDLIKILFQDDFLFDNNSLRHTIENFDETKKWLISTCLHTNDGFNYFRLHHPFYNHDIHLGNNTISSPSVITIKNNLNVFFDEELLWLMDVDFYKRMYIMYNEPSICYEPTIVNRIHDNQVSNTLATNEIKDNELIYIKKKYND